MNIHKEFELLREATLSEISGTARIWQHKTTGAQILSVSNDDENKCFGVTLRTPPKDSTGVAHILEHSVLCGSEKYPSKEPFVELLKGSLQTFLNAFTFPDKTCYPIASTNLQDFYNLVDVYLDAVFFPRLTPAILQQEGWHIDATHPDEPYAYKGVVYNEMKGVYSSPDSLLAEQSQQALFPDMTYGLDSGGSPEAILGLTWEAFQNFHKTHYTPSNARFFFWGDDPEEARLERLLPVLSRFKAVPTDSDVPLQAPLDMPRFIEIAYASNAEQGDDKAHVTLNWLVCETADTEEMLCLEMLEHILLGLPGSPLRKTLIESGLGEDVTGTGLECDLRQSYFSVGLRSIVPGTHAEVEHLIMETLASLAEDGLEADTISAAVNSVEFSLRENNSGRFPRGLAAMITALSTWLYDGDPLAPLAWEAPLANIKERLAKGETLFENAIKKYFLNNDHRATVSLLPDKTLAEQRQKQEQARLDALQAKFSPSDREALVAATQALTLAQETPDTPEALASIPFLTLDDLPRENKIIPCEKQAFGNIPVLTHELDTQGIAYLDWLFPLDNVPQHLLPLLPLMSRALTEMGTRRHDFVEIGLNIAAHTGGIGAGPLFATRLDTRKSAAYLAVTGKATRDNAHHLADLMAELLLETSFDNRERFTHMVLEERARMEQALIPSGHGFVATRVRSHFHDTAYLNELTGGIQYLESLRALQTTLTKGKNKGWESVCADLNQLVSCIIAAQGAICNITADAATLKQVLPLAEGLSQTLPKQMGKNKESELKRPASPKPLSGEALIVPAQVNYVGKGANLYDLGYTWHGSAHVITRYIRMAWLWEQVRVQGGAYGAFCGLDRATGTFTQVSYRDPNVEKTLTAFDGVGSYLKETSLSQRDLTLAIIGAIGDLDTYLLPDSKGMASLLRHVTNDDTLRRAALRDDILSTNAQHFRDFADIMNEVQKTGIVCVLGGHKAEEAAKKHQWSTKNIL